MQSTHQRFQQRFTYYNPNIMAQDENQIRRQVFTTINQANNKAERLPQCCIIIVGKTRTGKSTFHNLVVNANVLIGKEDGANTIYVLKNNFMNNPQVAKVDSTIKSVTVMPNVTILDKNTAMVDLPGFQDRGDWREVIKVQYIISKFLHKITKAKFVIIFTQSSFKDISNDQFRETLQNFLSMFHLDKCTLEDKRQLNSSIAFCVTSVDFRQKSYEKVKQRYLKQLKIMLQKLSAYNQSNPQAMSNFEVIKQLIKDIIVCKRIELFQLACEDESPKYNGILQRYNNQGWQYFNLNTNQQKITSRFNEQFKSLSEQNQQKLNELVKWRFRIGLDIRYSIGQMLNDSINSKDKTINIDQYLDSLNNIIKKMPEYHQNIKLDIANYCSSDQKLKIFEQLYVINQKIKDFNVWRDQNKFSSPLQYYTHHLVFIFRQQMNLVNYLFGSNQKANSIFKKILLNMVKLLNQAAIFSKLSQAFESDFNFKFKDQLILTQQLPKLLEIKRKYIQYFSVNVLKVQEYKTDELKKIIQTIANLKPEFNTQINPNYFYKISCKLRQASIRIYRSNNLVREQLQQSFYILIEAIKMHLNLALIKLSSQEQQLNLLAVLQSQILRQIALAISRFDKNQPLIKIHQQLQLAFQNLLKVKINIQIIKLAQIILRIIVDFGKMFNIIFIKDLQMPVAINLSSQFNIQAQVNNITNQYIIFNKNQILQEKFQVQLPPSHSIDSQLNYTNEIIQTVKDKKIIFVLGQAKSGKSLIISLLKGMKVQYFQGKYQLEGNTKSRINHTSQADPFICLSPINEDEFFMQIPSIFNEVEPDYRFIRICMLLKIINNISSFSIVLVQREESFQKPIFLDHINTILALLLKNNFIKNHPIPIILNTDRANAKMARDSLINHAQYLKNNQEKYSKQLPQLIKNKKLKLYFQDIRDYQNTAQDFHKDAKFQSEKPSKDYYNIYNQIYDRSYKQTFLKKIQAKANLLKNFSSQLIKISTNCWIQFQQKQQPSSLQKYYQEFDKLLASPLVKQYSLDKLTFSSFQPIFNNRTLIYANIMKVKSKGADLYNMYNYDKTYQLVGEYMHIFFNKLAYLCCHNKMQYQTFMKIKYLFASLLRQLQSYCLIFKDNKTNSDDEIKDLDNKLRLRFLTDQIDNFADFNEFDLLKNLIRQKSLNVPSQPQLQHYIQLLSKYSKIVSQRVISAKIELIILRRKFGPKAQIWSKDTDQRKLVDSIITYLTSNKMVTKRLMDYQRSIPKGLIPLKLINQKINNQSIPDEIVNELMSLKERVLNN